MDTKSITKTFFIDIDGTIIKHKGNATKCFTSEAELLPGVLEKFNQWSSEGHCIVLTTARRESMRKSTESELLRLGLFWDHLIMGVGSGVRIVINDMKTDENGCVPTAIGINLIRNEGFEHYEEIYSHTVQQAKEKRK